MVLKGGGFVRDLLWFWVIGAVNRKKNDDNVIIKQVKYMYDFFVNFIWRALCTI